MMRRTIAKLKVGVGGSESVITHVAWVIPLMGVAGKLPVELFGRFAFEHVASDLDAVAETLFREDVADVVLDRADADVHLASDLFVVQTLCDRNGDALFRVRERLIVKGGGFGVTISDHARDFGVCALHAIEYSGDNGNQFVRLERFHEVSVNA